MVFTKRRAMKDDELKRLLADAIMEEAPKDFTISVMDSIKKEELKSNVLTSYHLPAKGLLISLSIVFVVSILWAIIAGSNSQMDFSSLTQYIQFDAANIQFNELIFSNIVMYASIGFLIFLVLDYAIFSKRKIHIAG